MYLKKILLFSFFIFLAAQGTLKAQTTLTAGDLLFTSYNALPATGTPDTFSFVLFTPVTASTVIHFTERGYKGDGTWQLSGSTEGTISWTVGSALAAGTEIQIAGLGASAATVNGVPNGTVTQVTGGSAISGLSLSNAGDQIIAFQGGSGDPTLSSSMIGGISWHLNCGTTSDAAWNASGCTYGPQSSYMPPGLTGGVSAFLVGYQGATNNSHGKFNCTGVPYTNLTNLKLAILSFSNWTVNSSATTTAFDIPAACGTWYQSCVAPSITAQPPSRTICNNSNTTFSVSATGATAYQWQVNSGAGFSNISNGGVYSNATTNTLSITGAVSAMSGYMYRCIAYSGGGVCSTTSNSSALTVITVNTNSYSQTNIACFGGNTGMASVTPGGGYGPYTYSWSPSGGTASTASNLTAGSYTVTVTDAYSCTATRNFSIIQPSQLVLNTLSQTNVSCYGASTGAASVQAASGGTAPYTYNWTPGNPTGDGSTSVTGLTAGTWTVTVTDANGCTKQQSFTITQPSQSPGADSYSLPVSNQTVVQTVNSYNYVNSSCELINAVVPSGASPVSGSVTNKVWIESGVPTHAGIPYVQRHYEITPAVNASTATGTVTLYFTQAEFDAFNAHAGSTLDLPTGPLDAAGKSNLRIGKYSGSSGDGSGMPSTYSGSAIVIDPDDAAIVWNATSNAWEVSFAVSGFSGFIVQSVSGTLPVSWASFEVLQKQTAALLLWSTTSEQDASHFVIEHSTNGSNWTQVGIVAASGNSNSTKHYQFIHQQPVKGTNVYRIQQQDLNGNVHYSVIKQLRLSMIENTVDILSNPVENGLLKILVHNRTQLISLINSSGQTVWQQQVAAGVHTIPVGAFTKGVYLLRTENRTERILIK